MHDLCTSNGTRNNSFCHHRINSLVFNSFLYECMHLYESSKHSSKRAKNRSSKPFLTTFSLAENDSNATFRFLVAYDWLKFIFPILRTDNCLSNLTGKSKRGPFKEENRVLSPPSSRSSSSISLLQTLYEEGGREARSGARFESSSSSSTAASIKREFVRSFAFSFRSFSLRSSFS